MNIPIIVLSIVFLLIAFRQVFRAKLRIWQIMSAGAVAVLLTGRISPSAALRAIDLDVMLFLLGMFVVGHALEKSGYLAHISYKFFEKAKTTDQMVLFILFGMGMASAFLMNDTLAIIGVPVVLLLARKHGVSPKLLLLALAFAITTGSVASPIGNPQNLLIALRGDIANPFATFAKFLLAPTLLCLLSAYFLLKFFYKEQFHTVPLVHSQEPVRDHQLAVLSRISLGSIVVLAAAKLVVALVGLDVRFSLTYIAVLAALPILVFSRKRLVILKNLDWHTLVFFAAMFVLMQSVWDSGFLQARIAGKTEGMASVPAVLAVGVLLSQLISNVPLVALYLPMLSPHGDATGQLMALAAGSTIAGNLFILGAASNVIIIQNAEKRSHETLTFLEFARVGVPLTAIDALVYWLFLALRP
ncbi:MAG: anion transporter [Nitrospinae bacterium]|nr:anion transporter [Nitrospinota bacterium]